MAPSVLHLNPGIRFFDPGIQLPVPYTFAIIVSHYRGRWVWVKHKERSTWELPAGHVEAGETPLEAAHRELFEETGAVSFRVIPIVSYEGVYKSNPVFGMIFLAEILILGPLPDYEIGEICFFDQIPEELTYPQIQPAFYEYVLRSGSIESI